MKFIRYIKAFFRLNLEDVCAMSSIARDFHDYPDSTAPHLRHFHTHQCVRCGKWFRV